MNQPLVACLCLTRDRPEYFARAVKCFQSQTYAAKYFIVLSTGNWSDDMQAANDYIQNRDLAGFPIGRLRNFALGALLPGAARYVAHFDDDDWSGPDRLAEQVAHLEASGKSVTGYRDMVTYDANLDRVLKYDSKRDDYAVGNSLLYRREVWERTPFPDTTPEDTTWQHHVGHENISSVSCIRDGIPRLIQTLHKGNASAHYTPAAYHAAPEHEAFVRQVLEWGAPLPPLRSRQQFGKFVQFFLKQGTGVEVGTQHGVFAKQISKDWTGRLVCVDIWPDRQIFEVCTQMLADRPNVTMWRKDSLTASEDFADGGLDWVYIDADHHYEEVSADLEAWFPKVRKGGVVAGHDYVNYADMQVIRAVDEFAAKHGYHVNLTSEDQPFDGVRFPTWWFIK